VGTSPKSFDKQIVRDYLETLDWDKTPPAPALPKHISQKTADKYLELQALLCS
jgi:phosphoribosylaminoimidazole-succinocarboxamide synthase